MPNDLTGKAVKHLRLPTVSYESSTIKIISAQQGDSRSRYFSVELYDDGGTIDVTGYTNVTLNATLPNELRELYPGEIDAANNRAICMLPADILSQEGRVACDISFWKGDGEDKVVLTSQTFYVMVLPSQASEDAIIAQDSSGLLADIVTKEQERIDAERARQEAEVARVSAENTRNSNEETRKAAEATRDTNENARKSAEMDRANAEKQRASAESARQTAEANRASAEAARVTEFGTLKSNAEAATKNANDAAQAAKDSTVASEVVEYQLTDDGTLPASGWGTTMPAPVKGKYFWTRVTTTYGNKTTKTHVCVSYCGADGKTPTTATIDANGDLVISWE